MSATHQRRLARIEGSLTPRQAAILTVTEAIERYDCLTGYAAACRASGRYPRKQLGEQVVQSVEAAWKAKAADREQVYEAIHKAQMDADFLLVLALDCNAAVLDDSQSHAHQAAGLAEQLKYLLIIGSIGNASTLRDMPWRAWTAQWRVRAITHAGGVYRLNGAIESIRKQHFDDRPILFKDVATTQLHQLELIEQIVGYYNRTVTCSQAIDHGEKPCQDIRGQPMLFRDGSGIDLEAVRRTGQTWIESRVADLVGLAKAETLAAFGEDAKAIDLVWSCMGAERSA